MPVSLLQILRSRAFSLGIHAGLWVLLYLTLTHLGGKTPEWRENRSTAGTLSNQTAVARLEGLMSLAQWSIPMPVTNVPDPFITRHFVPPPTPAPPPPPTTRKVPVVYLGYFQTHGNPEDIIVKVGEAFVMARIGRAIETNLFIAQATMTNLLLTNLTAQTNLLPLNVKREIEVPIR